MGQFHPGSAGGANSSTGFGGDSLVNPWDFVLMLEGTLLFVASVARRTIAHASRQAAAPFAVRSSAAGFASASAVEKNRDEQWMPLWERPATLGELTSLIAEGRSQIGTRLAARPIDFGRAIARLGVTRGIAAFERYGYIERNGQANLAVPLGRWRVQAQPHQDLIDEVAGWVEGLRLRTPGPFAETLREVGLSSRLNLSGVLAVGQIVVNIEAGLASPRSRSTTCARFWMVRAARWFTGRFENR